MKLILISLLLSGVASPIAAIDLKNLNKDILVDNLQGITFSKRFSEDSVFRATVNDYADKLMANMGRVMLKADLDPLNLPDINETISRKVLFITYWGSLDLTNINLRELSTLSRYDDAVITYDEEMRKLTIDIPLEFKILKFECHYKAKLMGLGPSGRLTGEIKKIKMITSLEIDLLKFQAKVAKYKITHSGHFSIHFHQFLPINWLLNIVANTTTTIFKYLITHTIDKIVGGGMETIVNVINTVIADIINYFPEDKTTVTNLLSSSQNINFNKLIFN